jgi:hypothetical protein
MTQSDHHDRARMDIQITVTDGWATQRIKAVQAPWLCAHLSMKGKGRQARARSCDVKPASLMQLLKGSADLCVEGVGHRGARYVLQMKDP